MESNIIYNTDCLQGLKQLPNSCIDLVVTDPPYELSIHGGGGGFMREVRMKRWKKQMEESDIIDGFNAEILTEIERVCKPLNAYYFCSRLQLPMYMRYIEERGYSFDVLIWQKTNPMPLYGGHYLIDKEYIIHIKDKGVKVQPTSFEAAKTIFTHPINLKDKLKYKHPTIKPLQLIETLIGNSSKEGDIVLDPFLGSGTTAVAAYNLKRRYIGYEINKQFYDIANQRIEENKYKLF